MNKEKPYFSVSAVIPAYNAEATIERAINSILTQTRPVHEIIVVDDGSIDATAEIIKQFGSKVKYILQENAGASVARNTGVQAAVGNWIAFLDADDEWFSHLQEQQVAILTQYPKLCWCSANMYYSMQGVRFPKGDISQLKTGLAAKPYFDNYFDAQLKYNCKPYTPTMMIRKDIIEEAGWFLPGLLRGQDLDLWFRIAYKHPAIGYIAEPMAVVHLEDQEVTLTKRRIYEKRGIWMRELIARHLKLAEREGALEEFRRFAACEMLRRLRTMIYNGFKQDARETIIQFKDFFPKYIRIGAYILTIFPGLTSRLFYTYTRIKLALKLNRQSTRNYKRSEIKKNIHGVD